MTTQAQTAIALSIFAVCNNADTANDDAIRAIKAAMAMTLPDCSTPVQRQQVMVALLRAIGTTYAGPLFKTKSNTNRKRLDRAALELGFSIPEKTVNCRPTLKDPNKRYTFPLELVKLATVEPTAPAAPETEPAAPETVEPAAPETAAPAAPAAPMTMATLVDMILDDVSANGLDLSELVATLAAKLPIKTRGTLARAMLPAPAKRTGRKSAPAPAAAAAA